MKLYAAVSDGTVARQRTDSRVGRVSLGTYVLLVSACGPAISSAPFVERAPRPPDHPVLIYSVKLPTCPYEEIGIIHGMRVDRSLESTLDAVKKRARAMGGDAVVGLSQTQTVNDGFVVGNMVNLGGTEGLAGTVIRFTDEACREQQK